MRMPSRKTLSKMLLLRSPNRQTWPTLFWMARRFRRIRLGMSNYTSFSPLWCSLRSFKERLADSSYFSTTAALANPPNWGTPINSMSPSPTKTEVNAKLGKEVVASATGTNHEVDGNDIVLASELVESIEVESYKTGDTIIVTTA